MSPRSPVFLEVNEYEEVEREPNVRRARSDGHLEYFDNKEAWKRHEEARQMVPYHGRSRSGAFEQQTSSNRLAVPMFEVPQRRQRARSDTRTPSRDFKTTEFRPSPQPIVSHGTMSDPVIPESKIQRGSTHTKAPKYERPRVKIPTVVFQEHPPDSRTPDQQSGRSPNASPRSSSGQPQLQYKYLQLQNKLADVTLACVRYIKVEPANPRDLTFEKLSEQVKGFSLDLRVWYHVANIQNLARRDLPEGAGDIADAASRTMDRLIDRAEELHDACSKSKPSDLKFDGLPKVEDEDAIFDDAGSDMTTQDPTESLGYIIDASLHSIRLLIKGLKRLTRSLQEVTPEGKEEAVAVASLVEEARRYFGSDAALDRYPVDKKYSGRRALEEARYTVSR